MEPTLTGSLTGTHAGQGTTATRDAQLMKAAKALETSFLSEMLGHVGLGAIPKGFGGGGTGEEQFASFLRDAQAAKMVEHGGIGLAERLFHALKERADGGS